MKKYPAVLLPLIFGLLMVTAVLAGTSNLSMQETDLTPKPLGEALEVNSGSDGLIYVSDYGAKQIWRVNPANIQVDKYTFPINVSDAKPDAAGDIWFVDGDTTFARLDPNSNQAVYWDVPLGHYLGSLTFDNSGKLWMAEYAGYISNVYRFDISSTELCTYTLPTDGSQSDYIIYDKDRDKVWLANWFLHRIYRLDISQDPVQADWWTIPYTYSRPVGIALDNLGNLWWADSGMGALAYLNQGTDIMTRYNLPNPPAKPEMIALQGGAVWFTAGNSVTKLGYLGVLDSQQASGVDIGLVKDHTNSISSLCKSTLGPGSDLYVAHTTGNPEWKPGDLTSLESPSAWQVYQLPNGVDPYGSIPWGIALKNNNVWMVDQGRQKLMRAPFGSNIFLPIVLR